MPGGERVGFQVRFQREQGSDQNGFWFALALMVSVFQGIGVPICDPEKPANLFGFPLRI